MVENLRNSGRVLRNAFPMHWEGLLAERPSMAVREHPSEPSVWAEVAGQPLTVHG